MIPSNRQGQERFFKSRASLYCKVEDLYICVVWLLKEWELGYVISSGTNETPEIKTKQNTSQVALSASVNHLGGHLKLLKQQEIWKIAVSTWNANALIWASDWAQNRWQAIQEGSMWHSFHFPNEVYKNCFSEMTYFWIETWNGNFLGWPLRKVLNADLRCQPKPYKRHWRTANANASRPDMLWMQMLHTWNRAVKQLLSL